MEIEYPWKAFEDLRGYAEYLKDEHKLTFAQLLTMLAQLITYFLFVADKED